MTVFLRVHGDSLIKLFHSILGIFFMFFFFVVVVFTFETGLIFLVLRQLQGWRDGSVDKSTDCSSKGPEFKSQQPHGGSQPPIMRSDTLFWYV